MSVGAASASAAIDLDCQYSGFRLTPGQSLAEVIPRVAIAELTAERFFAEFVSTRRPCIVVGHPRLPHSEATAACAPSASKRPRTEAGGAWNLPNELLAEVAGEAQVAVEVGQPQTQGNQCFGHSERQTMPFATFLERLGSGDESLYLTAQTTQQDDTERPGLCAAPAEQLLLHQQIPLTVPLAGSLVLAQINVWMGRSKAGASSGLHHDFHDNLYVLVRGSKQFQLWSPDAIGAIPMAGTPVLVHPNGRVCYAGDEQVYADGSWTDGWEQGNEEEGEAVADEEEDADADPGFDLGEPPTGDDSDDDIALEAALEAAIDGRADTDDFGDDGGSVAGDHAMETPKNFSTIGHPDCTEVTRALFGAQASAAVKLGPGDMLYLPCGWFHNVTSADQDGSEGGHLAVNYWYHPPDKLDSGHLMPYTTDFWNRDWGQRCNSDAVLQVLATT